jgi:anti-anti-sigma factor
MSAAGHNPAGVGTGSEQQPLRAAVHVDPADPERLWLTGDVDLHAVEAAGTGLWEALRGVRVVEAGGVTFMDSTGLRCLTAAMGGARLAGVRLTVVDPPPQVRHVLRVSGVEALVDVVEDGGPAPG